MIKLTSFPYENRYSFLLLFGILTVVVVVNILTISNVANIFITIPQFAIVIGLVLNKDYKNAVLWHFVFIMTSISAQRVYGKFDTHDVEMFNYATIKLVGPIRACYLINILLLLLLLGKKRIVKHLLLYKLLRTMFFLGGMATMIGIGGLLASPYYSFNAFIACMIYMFILLSSILILLLIADRNVIKTSYYVATCCLMSSVVGSLICYLFFNVTTSYSIFEVVSTVDLTYFAPSLLIGLLFIKNRGILYITIICYAYITFIVSSGKEIFSLAFCLLALFYLIYFDKQMIKQNTSRLLLFRVFAIIAIIYAATNVVLTEGSQTYNKIMAASSMVAGNISEMSASPYIRVASLMNIISEGLKNPFILIFGNGYGGYFEDGLHLFSGLDLSQGAWHGEDLVTGKYHTGHDTMVSVPLYNGLFGLILLVKICIPYIKRIKYNYLGSVAFLWIILIFYSNTIFAYTGVFLLLASEYTYNDTKLK